VRDANAVANPLEHQGFEVLRLLDSQATLSVFSHLLIRACRLPSARGISGLHRRVLDREYREGRETTSS
jgi:hypothetical protein